MINLKGPLTIEKAGEIRDIFIRNLNEEDSIQIDFSQIKEIDLSFIQLLFALKKEANFEINQSASPGLLMKRFEILFLWLGFSVFILKIRPYNRKKNGRF